MVTPVPSAVLTIISNPAPQQTAVVQEFPLCQCFSVRFTTVISDLSGPSQRMDPRALTSPLRMWVGIKVHALLIENTFLREPGLVLIMIKSIENCDYFYRPVKIFRNQLICERKKKKNCYRATMLPVIEMDCLKGFRYLEFQCIISAFSLLAVSSGIYSMRT